MANGLYKLVSVKGSDEVDEPPGHKLHWVMKVEPRGEDPMRLMPVRGTVNRPVRGEIRAVSYVDQQSKQVHVSLTTWQTDELTG
jgi:hypothetical protein